MKIGTPLSSGAVKAVLLGSGELGKEVVIELQRFGIEVIACDRYENAPAMQVAHRSAVFDMLDGKKIRDLVYREKPDLIIPEIEAIDTETLLELENEGYRVIPTAKAARLTMDREGIRRLAAEQLGLLTSPYRFADSLEEFRAALKEIGIPCVVKPVMSSSGKGQSVIRSESEAEAAFEYAMKGGRAKKNRIIIEGFIDFDFEITLLTLRHSGGTSFCEPIGHIQIDGDYRESWQPQPMSEAALKASKEMAAGVTEALGGYGIFGVELFVKGDTVYFSEVSPRPHDTGLVTLVSQDLSEFALHTRAVLGLPVPEIRTLAPSASYAFLVEGDSRNIFYTGAEKALSIPGVSLRLFGKPSVVGKRRMGVVLATGKDTAEARKKAGEAGSHLKAVLL